MAITTSLGLRPILFMSFSSYFSCSRIINSSPFHSTLPSFICVSVGDPAKAVFFRDQWCITHFRSTTAVCDVTVNYQERKKLLQLLEQLLTAALNEFILTAKKSIKC